MKSNYDIGIGVLIFNPNDDKEHLERVEKCIASIVIASNNSNKKTLLMFLINMSVIGKPQLEGTGPITRSLVKKLVAQAKNEVIIDEIKSPHSMNVKHYSYLQSTLHNAGCAKVAVFADDYILPTSWFDTVMEEFKQFPDADFITPSTSFVAQENLLIPLKYKSHWQKVTHNNHVYGVISGISQDDVDEISKSCSNYPAINYLPPPSFETTIFTSTFLKQHGYVNPKYFSILYNTEYFQNAVSNGAKGYISRKSYVFHYGKGGTSAIEKEKGDEKYAGSPAEKYLIKDIALYNKNTKSSIKPWWANDKEVARHIPPDNCQIKLQMDSYQDIGAKRKYVNVKDLRDTGIVSEFKGIKGWLWHRSQLRKKKRRAKAKKDKK